MTATTQLSLLAEPATRTQARQILEHLQRGEALTPLEALDRYGCFRLAARIKDLRALGYAIQTDSLRLPNGKTVARYRLQ